MASTCISNTCADVARVPVRATYVNLYKWPESDVEFIRSLSSNERSRNGSRGGGGVGHHYHHPKVVDSISCRQLYLRSYTFSRDDDDFDDHDKRKRSCTRFRERMHAASNRRRKRKLMRGGGSEGGRVSGGRRKYTGFRKAKEVSCAALEAIFRRLLSCTTKVDVVG
ncbi:hypothetical protein ACH5RR_009999 [Cinchona calisaya]|uniref:Uncharacterized protein n=1 Tax=Cinchona calisaya TaxID=153742 RepID=A0ABD3AHW5_9GENT